MVVLIDTFSLLFGFLPQWTGQLLLDLLTCFTGFISPSHTCRHPLQLNCTIEVLPYRFFRSRMRPENVLKWLDAVDQDHLDPLDQWGVPPPQRPPQDIPTRPESAPDGGDGETYQQYNTKPNAEVASLLESIPPAGILLRNGSIRVTGQNPKVLAYEAGNENHPGSLAPGLPTCFAHNVEKENRSQSLIPAFATSSEASGQRTDPPPTRQLQSSGREGNIVSANPKRLPTFLRVRDLSGASHSTPIIHVEVKDPVAINCQGARVVEGYQQNGLQSLPSMVEKSRRNTSAGEGALHRRNATRRPSNVHAGPRTRRKN